MMLDLMQRQGGFNAPPPNDAAAVFFGSTIFLVFLCVIGLFAVLSIVGQILMCIKASRALSLCRPKYRKMSPGMVWLAFIPMLNYVWFFLMALQVADSLKDEYEARGLRGDGDFGRTMGLVHAIGYIICGISALLTPFLVAGSLGKYIRELEGDKGRSKRNVDEDDEDIDEDDDEEDAPRRRR